MGAPIPDRFTALVKDVTTHISNQPLDENLQADLSRKFPADGNWFSEMQALCRKGCEDGWLCAREMGGIRFGRPIKPSPDTQNFSVDVVEMDAIVGPHHKHPNGEIDLVMPYDNRAMFDGVHKGWKVYGADSAHCPTVAGGKALILYLLPQGAIEFSSTGK